jgi:hypothetical protein
MDTQRPVQRPNAVARQAAPAAQQQASAAHQAARAKAAKTKKKWIIILILVLVAAGLAYWALNWLRVIGPMAGIKTDKYQAVFLANQQSQVYFGKITAITDDTVVLKDVYYIKSNSNDSTDDKQPQQQQQAVLTKIDSASELHKPYNEMRINRDQVLFWENLQDDSKIVSTIKSDTKQ